MMNRKTQILLHDNARIHVAQQILVKLNNLKFETLPYPPYSPGLSSTDYNFFKALDHFLSWKVLSDEHSPNKVFQEFVASRTSDFYHHGIQKLISRWEKYIQSKGDYFD